MNPTEPVGGEEEKKEDPIDRAPSQSVEEQKMVCLQGDIRLNGTALSDQIDLSSINSLQAFSEAINAKIGERELTSV